MTIAIILMGVSLMALSCAVLLLYKVFFLEILNDVIEIRKQLLINENRFMGLYETVGTINENQEKLFTLFKHNRIALEKMGVEFITRHPKIHDLGDYNGKPN
jgi:hypothetical protein